MIYLDNAATTKIDPEVLKAMMPYLTNQYGNAGTLYKLGTQSKAAVQEARELVAAFVGASDPRNIIFTSGGTESNNMVFLSLCDSLKAAGKTHIITDNSEHDSILRAVERLSVREGFDVTYLDTDANGCVLPEAVAAAIREDTGLVSVMYMNNETGAENSVREIAHDCRDKGILFHTDCVQAAGCCDLSVDTIGCDFMSISSHKIHGPKGVGALYARSPALLEPLIAGGRAQEFGLRGGTENVAGIVGFGKACELMKAQRHDVDIHCSTLKQLFYAHLVGELGVYGFADSVHINGPSVMKHGKTINLRFDKVEGETLLLLMDSKGVCISAGSACTSHELKPSHVLTAMGVDPEDAMRSVRVSFSKMNTREEVFDAARIMAECVNTIRSW